MSLTATPLLTDISLCEALTGWTGGSYLALETGVQKQGTYCLGDWIDATTGTIEKYTYGTAVDMSAAVHLYFWAFCSGKVDTKANGGYRLYAEDSSGNYKTWYVAGSDTHPAGGWVLLCVSLDASTPYYSGTLNTASIKVVGIQFKTLTAAPIKGQTRFNNCFWDAVRRGTGVKLTSGATDQIDMADIFSADDTSFKWGVTTKPSDVNSYVIDGKLVIGDDSGTNSMDLFWDTETILFPLNPLMGTANGVYGAGNSTGTTTIEISGSFIASYGVPFALSFNDSDIDSLDFLGNTVVNALNPTFITGQTVQGNVFSGCDQILPGSSYFTYNTIKGYTGSTGALLFTSNNTQNCTFEMGATSSHAIYITTPGSYNLTGHTFTGYATSDGSDGDEVIYNNSGGSVTLNVSNCVGTVSVMNGSGASTTVNNNVQVTFAKLKDDTEVRIYNASTGVEVDGTEEATDGDPDNRYFTWSAPASLVVNYVIHNWGGDPTYQTIRVNGYTVPSGNTTIDIQQLLDRNAE